MELEEHLRNHYGEGTLATTMLLRERVASLRSSHQNSHQRRRLLGRGREGFRVYLHPKGWDELHCPGIICNNSTWCSLTQKEQLPTFFKPHKYISTTVALTPCLSLCSTIRSVLLMLKGSKIIVFVSHLVCSCWVDSAHSKGPHPFAMLLRNIRTSWTLMKAPRDHSGL